MSSIRNRSLLLLLPLAALSWAACGDDSTSSATSAPSVAETAAGNTAAPDTATAETAAPDTATAETGAPGAAAATIQLADNALGSILVDGDGNTLYLFGNDKPDAPACDAGCLGSWPALVSEGDASVGTGLSLEDLGTVTAADGSTQVTFYGHPLYHFAGDAAPGDTNGQGLGGVWYVVDGEGNAVK
jgi:predicted lipoprotein with Yx(FWY)xxD motif